MHPAKERIAAVLGSCQGSGYLLEPRLVLTAGHVVAGAAGARPRVVVPGGVGPVGCRVVWARDDDRCDAALLAADRNLVPDEAAAAFAPLGWGRVNDLQVWPDAQAIGFPGVQRTAAGELDTEQFTGTLKTGSQLLGGRYVLDGGHRAPAAVPGGESPWAGMSGAAVFVNGFLVGVVCADPGGWRHGRLLVTPVITPLTYPAFHRECARAGHRIAVCVLASSQDLEREKFERRLRDYLIKKAGELTIVGLTLSDGEEEAWPLDAAYLSLELIGAEGRQEVGPVLASEGFGGSREVAVRSVPSPQRAEAALAGQQRVLLRGAAGSGKTTLLQWLATITARGELPPGLDQLSGCMPLTLSLRTLIRAGSLPGPGEFLTCGARPLAGLPAAEGWAAQRMAEGGMLLLIDGVDEVPEADRRRTLAWLKDLLAAYPDARYVVTTRPSAVREGWLAEYGFTELELLPMSRSDVTAFIDRWHATAEQCVPPDERQGERERLRAFRDVLAAAVIAKPDLGRLATNPLMCALICALNRSRRGHLPRGRMELYRAALELLLVRRDREREIMTGPEVPELDHAQQLALLQKIAYWLIRNGRSEIEWHKAVEIVVRVLPAMPSMAAAGGDAERILRHLVLRSGLLRRPTNETLDFIHRTFQDYLGAKAAVDDWDFDVLVEHAHDDQWEDVLRMAVGHAPRRARGELFGKLLARGEREEAHRYRLRLLAAACLEHATEVDPGVRAQVERAAAELVPPRDVESAKALAEAGHVVLDLLPGPEGLTDEVASAVVVAATAVADDRAIPLLAEYAALPCLGVRAQLAWAWDRFDTDHYAAAVIARLADAGLWFVAKSRAHLAVLKALGGRCQVECYGLTGGELADLPTEVLAKVWLRASPEAVDLRALAACPPLRGVLISDTEGVSHLGALNSDALRSLNLRLTECPDDLDTLSGMPWLTSLQLDWHAPAPARPGSRRPSLPPRLQAFSMGRGASADLRLSLVRDHPALQMLRFDGPGITQRERLVLGTLPQLTDLTVVNEDLASLACAEPLPRIVHLGLSGPVGLARLTQVPRAYPNLESLTIHTPAGSAIPLDLAQLRGLEALKRVEVAHSGPVLNSELLPTGSRLLLGRGR